MRIGEKAINEEIMDFQTVYKWKENEGEGKTNCDKRGDRKKCNKSGNWKKKQKKKKKQQQIRCVEN